MQGTTQLKISNIYGNSVTNTEIPQSRIEKYFLRMHMIFGSTICICVMGFRSTKMGKEYVIYYIFQ